MGETPRDAVGTGPARTDDLIAVWLVRHYDYEMQEVEHVAADRASAVRWIAEQIVTARTCRCPDGMHDEEYPVEDCIDSQVRNATDGRALERWQVGAPPPPVEADDPIPEALALADAIEAAR